MLTKEQQVLRARKAAHGLHARGLTNTAPGTKAFLDRFEREVDPEGVLDPAERAKRSEHARKSYFLGLALKSSQKRSASVRVSSPSPQGVDGFATLKSRSDLASATAELERKKQALR